MNWDLALTIAAGILIAYAVIACAPLIAWLALAAACLVAFVVFVMLAGPAAGWILGWAFTVIALPFVLIGKPLAYAILLLALLTPILGWLAGRYRGRVE